jgi:ethanolamine utilization protein EutQ (cupin superfamily)
MTEKDAWRVLSAVGGNPGSTRNKEVVAKLLEQIMEKKLRKYNGSVLNAYNRSAEKHGASVLPKINLDKELFKINDGREAIPIPGIGTVIDGYLFHGEISSDPNNPKNWIEVQGP